MTDKHYYLILNLNRNIIYWAILDENHNPLDSGKKIIWIFFAKRIIRHSLKIIDRVIKTQASAPSKIFLHTAKNSPTPTRKERFIELYEKFDKTPEIEELLKELNSKDYHAFHGKKLYLYFTQMGRCAYSGERIDFAKLSTETYDIDHIYPRSKIKDDGITRNLVLVKKDYNKIKGDNYPINSEWQEHMSSFWDKWQNANLITEEKYYRLTRKTPLTPNELKEFSSQKTPVHIQSAKILESLLCQKYPKTEIIFFEF